MRTLLRLAVLTLAITAQAQTVFVFSLDGLGHHHFSRFPLKTLQRLAARGATAAGIQPAFPSTTANSHAALWTGAYADVSHIAANSQPLLPRAAHTFLERNNGFRSDQLAAEPIWVAAARQNVKTVVYQAPQAFPFRDFNTHTNATTLNGYQSRQIARHAILRRKDLTFTSPTEFHFQHGPVTLKGVLSKTGLTIENTPVPHAPAESQPPFKRPLARRFSQGLYIDSPVPAVVYFRLFERTETDLLLYISPIQELAISQGSAVPLLKESGGFFGNTYQGPLFTDAQSLEVMELLARQNARHTEWLTKHLSPGLFIGYLPIIDELGHRYLGLYEQKDPSAQKAMLWGYTIAERWSQQIARLLTKKDHLILTADHGMAPTYKLVSVNEILRRAGLGSKATHIYNSVLLNTTDWKGGTVTDRLQVRAQVQQALQAQNVFTGFYTPEQHGAQYGIGGPAGSDLYFDLQPGYYVRDAVGEIFPPLDKPAGNHGFRPDREDMLAVLFATGPKLKPGTQWPRLKSIDVAPLAAKLLSIDPPRHAKGTSPF
jgi:hypothetical protein